MPAFISPYRRVFVKTVGNDRLLEMTPYVGAPARSAGFSPSCKASASARPARRLPPSAQRAQRAARAGEFRVQASACLEAPVQVVRASARPSTLSPRKNGDWLRRGRIRRRPFPVFPRLKNSGVTYTIHFSLKSSPDVEENLYHYSPGLLVSNSPGRFITSLSEATRARAFFTTPPIASAFSSNSIRN